jgi:undecaprenyl-diphosphatase
MSARIQALDSTRLRMKHLKLRLDVLDVRLCEQGNRLLDNPTVHLFFKVISRMGDGPFWYVLMFMLPLFAGVTGLVASFLMAACAWAGVGLYTHIKQRLQRPRPFALHPHIRAGARILDEYSFPSGHTLHAVAFMILVGGIFPWMLVVLVPFALLTALARVVLGLHYPSDVLAGGVIGLFFGSLTLSLSGWVL